MKAGHLTGPATAFGSTAKVSFWLLVSALRWSLARVGLSLAHFQESEELCRIWQNTSKPSTTILTFKTNVRKKLNFFTRMHVF